MSFNSDMLVAYQNAEKALLSGQEIRWGDRWLKRADLGMVQNGRREYEAKVAAENRAAAGAPRDNVVLADFSNFPASGRWGGDW